MLLIGSVLIVILMLALLGTLLLYRRLTPLVVRKVLVEVQIRASAGDPRAVPPGGL